MYEFHIFFLYSIYIEGNLLSLLYKLGENFCKQTAVTC